MMRHIAIVVRRVACHQIGTNHQMDEGAGGVWGTGEWDRRKGRRQKGWKKEPGKVGRWEGSAHDT